MKGSLNRLVIPLALGALAIAACVLPGRRGGEGAAPITPPAAATQAAPETATTAPGVETHRPAPTEAATSAATMAPDTATPGIAPLVYATGRNDYEIELEGVPRKFIVYVPDSYDAGRPAPVVFMFHGSNQGGPLMYEKTSWADKADQEGFIVVYPTSWKYFLVTENKVADKWNVASLHQVVEPGTELKDDVAFVREMLKRLQATFNVDGGRVYATGFSNGGGFVLTRLMIEMHDVFAAFATSGSGLWAEGQLERLPTGIDASLYSVMGDSDNKVAEGIDYPLPFPNQPEAIAADAVLSVMLGNATTILSLDPAVYEAAVERPSFTTLTFRRSLAGAGNEYVFRMVNNMGHVYPSGDNNRAGLDAADLFWDFFVRHARP